MTRYGEHPGLAWLRHQPGGPEWLDGLDATVAGCRERWQLNLGPAFDSFASLALPVTTAEGEPAVLKIDYPDDETRWAPDALRCWGGDGAVLLLDEDRDGRAQLLERCDPGTPLTGTDTDEAIDVVADLLPRLWRPAGPPFRSLADECARWASNLAGRWAAGGEPFPRAQLELASRLLEELSATQGEQVLVHQDLHGGNVLRAQRRPWLAIDPKPLVGERAFALSPVIRSFELGNGRTALGRRLDRLTAAFGLDRRRAAAWAFAHTVAWNAGGGGHPGHLAAIGWLYELL